jgi:hypothetical protein
MVETENGILIASSIHVYMINDTHIMQIYQIVIFMLIII